MPNLLATPIHPSPTSEADQLASALASLAAARASLPTDTAGGVPDAAAHHLQSAQEALSLLACWSWVEDERRAYYAMGAAWAGGARLEVMQGSGGGRLLDGVEGLLREMVVE